MLAGWCPAEGMRENLSQASLRASGGLPGNSGIPWFIDLCLNLHMGFSLCVFVSKFPPFLRTQSF